MSIFIGTFKEAQAMGYTLRQEIITFIFLSAQDNIDSYAVSDVSCFKKRWIYVASLRSDNICASFFQSLVIAKDKDIAY